MAFRRKRISAEQMDGFIARLMKLGIQEADLTSDQMLSLPLLEREKGLTCYGAAYRARALGLNLPIATTGSDLRKAATAAGIRIAAA
jgi:predicted nucleic acid-binding protein